VAQEHWCSSGFANTDLDLQLKKHGIHQLIVMGLIAHTCIESTVRFAAELGYEVAMIKDATPDYTDEMMHAALHINIPLRRRCCYHGRDRRLNLFYVRVVEAAGVFYGRQAATESNSRSVWLIWSNALT
jgi:nicotinamidase-related amidase